MRRTLLCAAAALALAVSPVAAAISTPTPIGWAVLPSGSSSQVLITTTAAVPAGNAIFVGSSSNASRAPTGCTDPVNGTYATALSVYDGTGHEVAGYWTTSTAGTPSGTTITCTYSNSSAALFAFAITFSGAGAVDLKGSGATGTSTSPAISVATPNYAGELVLVLSNDNLSATFTESAGFTNLYTKNDGSAPLATLSYQLQTAAASASYAATLSASDVWGVNYVTFSPAGSGGGGGGGVCTLGIMGVGPC
jgi:hypothetical protein